MRLSIQAKPSAKQEQVKEISPRTYQVCVKEPPRGGQANAAIKTALAKHLGISASRISIVSGYTSRRKIIEID